MDGGEEWQDAVVDLNEVASFFTDEHADGSSITSVSLKSGNEFSLDTSFVDFLNVMRSSGQTINV